MRTDYLFILVIFVLQILSVIGQEPQITISTTTTPYTTLFPGSNTAEILILSQDVTLEANIAGIWERPDKTYSNDSAINFDVFTVAYVGLYKFYAGDVNGEVTIQIVISATGSNFAEMTSSGVYAILSDNNVFYNDRTLVCATSDTSTEPEWSRDGAVITGTWDDVTGISTLDITISQQGYYTCSPVSGTSYTVAIFNPDITIIAQSGVTYYYTKDIDPSNIQLLCTTTDLNKALESIEWTIPGQTNRNPAILEEFPNSITQLNCFAGQLTVKLRIQGPPVITLSTAPDTTYSMLPTASDNNRANIPVLSENVMLQTNLLGRWLKPDGSSTDGNFIEFIVFTVDLVGIYQFSTVNWENQEEKAILINISAAGTRIGMEADSSITTISSNTIFYQDTITLIAATNKITLQQNDVVWSYQRSFNDTKSNIPETSNEPMRSISKLNLDTKPNGYYTVSIRDDNSMTHQYIVGVFNSTNVYDTRTYKNFNYSFGIDIDESILCIPPHNKSRLVDIRWKYGSIAFPNPVNFETISYQIYTTENVSLKCVDISNPIIEYGNIRISINNLPIITILYNANRITITGLEDNDPLEIVVFTSNVLFECNKLECSWLRDDSEENPISSEREFTIPYISIDNNHEYILYTLDQDDYLIPSVSVTIKPIGTAFLSMTQADTYQELITNSIININENISLACATSYIFAEEDDIEWFYQETSIADPGAITGDYDPTFGLSTLTIDKPGYYTCRVSDEIQNKIEYTVAIIDNRIPTKSISQEDFGSDSPFNYTLGQSLRYSYQNENIPITAIRWGVEVGSTELEEFLNPVDVNEVFAKFGSGAYKFRCFYRQSPITNVGNISLNMKDYASLIVESDQGTNIFKDTGNPNFPDPQNLSITYFSEDVLISCSLSSCRGVIEKDGNVLYSKGLNIDYLTIENQGLYSLRRTTSEGVEYTTASFNLFVTDIPLITVSYEGFNMTFSDATNPMFPSPQNISILEGTKDVSFTRNLPEYLLLIPNGTYFIKMSAYIIPEISVSDTGEYSLLRVTSSGQEYITARIYIQVLLAPIEPLPDNHIIQIIIIVITIIVIIGAIIILITIFGVIYIRKRKRSYSKLNKPLNGPKSDVTDAEHKPGNVNLSEIPQTSKEYIDLSFNTNPEYMTIDETSMIPLESEPETTDYANLSNKQAYNPTPKYHTRVHNKEYIELDADESYEKYMPMRAITDEKKFTSEFIPKNQFAATYKQYIESGIGKNSLLFVEFENLNEQSKKIEELEFEEALKMENTKKILPFDYNRVMLNSIHFDCNYINASWLESHQFIATINPTKETHLDFLQMIYQTEASMVIMLTTRKEKAKILSGISNRVCYWPKKDEPINCEPFVSTLINSTETNAFVKQEICLKNTLAGKEHSFTQCISPIWNEDGTVLDSNTNIVSRIVKQKRDFPNKPIIIHCEDGITKTGILMTVVNTVEELNFRNSINIFNAVKSLRRQRMKMVPTLACYTTCYSLMNEYCSIHL